MFWYDNRISKRLELVRYFKRGDGGNALDICYNIKILIWKRNQKKLGWVETKKKTTDSNKSY